MDGLFRSIGSSVSNLFGGVVHAAGDALGGVAHAANNALPGGVALLVAFIVLVIVAWNVVRR